MNVSPNGLHLQDSTTHCPDKQLQCWRFKPQSGLQSFWPNIIFRRTPQWYDEDMLSCDDLTRTSGCSAHLTVSTYHVSSVVKHSHLWLTTNRKGRISYYREELCSYVSHNNTIPARGDIGKTQGLTAGLCKRVQLIPTHMTVLVMRPTEEGFLKFTHTWRDRFLPS